MPPQNRPTIDRYIDRQIGRHYYSKQDPTFLGESQKAGKPPGGGNSAYERGGDARRKFCIKPLKETDLGVAQEFFDP